MNICHTRVAVDGHDVESVPKTEAGRRTLPIPTTLYSALLHARAMQTRQRMNAGGQYVDSGYVVVDELGLPYRTQNLTKQWRKTCDRLGLPRITLHDERHTCATLHILNGANPAVMKVWLGHTSIRFMYDTYVHSQPDGLLKIAEAHAELARVVTLLDDKKPA
jgi:integrase